MIRIDVTPSADLARLLDQPKALLDRAGALGARRAAESYADAIHDWIHAGRSFVPGPPRPTSEGENLEQTIGWRPDGDGAEVFANAPHAPWVEYGTRPHEIRPKPGRKALRWFPGGGKAAFARSVQHPGTDPLPFFFADMDARQTDMQEEARLALAEVLLGTGAAA